MLVHQLQEVDLRAVASCLDKHIRSEKGVAEAVRITLEIVIFWS